MNSGAETGCVNIRKSQITLEKRKRKKQLCSKTETINRCTNRKRSERSGEERPWHVSDNGRKNWQQAVGRKQTKTDLKFNLKDTVYQLDHGVGSIQESYLESEMSNHSYNTEASVESQNDTGHVRMAPKATLLQK